MTPSNPDRVELFDRWAESYDSSVARNSFPLAGYDEVLKAIVHWAEIGPNHRVLDVGTGTGNLAEHIAPTGCSIWGVDFSEKMLKRARAKLPAVRLIRADLLDGWPENLPDRLDRIVSAYVFHEFPDREKLRLIESFAGHLTFGGRIVIGDVAFPDEGARSKCRRVWRAVWDEDEYYWAVDSIRPALEALGLLVEYRQVSFCGGILALERAGTE